MAREKSEYLSAFGIAFRIFKAVADAVLRAGGNDEALRLAEKPEVADKLAAVLMAEASQKAEKPQPDLDGLSEVFEVKVRGRTVKCAWIPRNYFSSDPTNQEVMDETSRRHLRCPSREIAVAAFDLKKREMAANPSVAIDGLVQTGADGNQIVGCVNERAIGRDLDLDGLQGYWYRSYRFLVVVSE
ncbi:MAG: hypothetical protein ABH835_00515 [Patescibacteria group bacterium]